MTGRADAIPAAAALAAAEKHCASLARRHARNFYWGFIGLPRAQRSAIYALYGFARQVDDEVDCKSVIGAEERIALQRARLQRCLDGQPDDPVTLVLANAVAWYGIPAREIHDLVDGVEADLHVTRYQTWEELAEYCRLVASTVGRMCVRVFGYDDHAALLLADDLGRAMQLTNILRDVREDLVRGRRYLPQEDLDRFGVAEGQIGERVRSAEWDRLVRFEAERARRLFASGMGVVGHIPRRAGVCVRTMAGMYQRILREIDRDPSIPLAGRLSLGGRTKVGIMLGAWLS